MTNFEKIKSMSIEKIKSISIEKMAEIIDCPTKYDDDFSINQYCFDGTRDSCRKCRKNYLEADSEYN